jgi:hypothetical protein
LCSSWWIPSSSRTLFGRGIVSCLVFQRRPSTSHMCAQEVHTYNNRIEISETMLYSGKHT